MKTLRKQAQEVLEMRLTMLLVDVGSNENNVLKVILKRFMLGDDFRYKLLKTMSDGLSTT